MNIAYVSMIFNGFLVTSHHKSTICTIKAPVVLLKKNRITVHWNHQNTLNMPSTSKNTPWKHHVLFDTYPLKKLPQPWFRVGVSDLLPRGCQAAQGTQAVVLEIWGMWKNLGIILGYYWDYYPTKWVGPPFDSVQLVNKISK